MIAGESAADVTDYVTRLMVWGTEWADYQPPEWSTKDLQAVYQFADAIKQACLSEIAKRS